MSEKRFFYVTHTGEITTENPDRNRFNPPAFDRTESRAAAERVAANALAFLESCRNQRTRDGMEPCVGMRVCDDGGNLFQACFIQWVGWMVETGRGVSDIRDYIGDPGRVEQLNADRLRRNEQRRIEERPQREAEWIVRYAPYMGTPGHPPVTRIAAHSTAVLREAERRLRNRGANRLSEAEALSHGRDPQWNDDCGWDDIADIENDGNRDIHAADQIAAIIADAGTRVQG